MKRPREQVSTEAYLEAQFRMAKALVRRAEEFDITNLYALRELCDLYNAVLAQCVRTQRSTYGYSWAEIGKAMAVSRQAAQQRYGN